MIRIEGIDFRTIRVKLAEAIYPEESDMTAMGAHVLDTIHYRTTVENVDGFGVPFKDYSTNPIYISGRYKRFAAGGRRKRLQKIRRLGKSGKWRKTGSMRSVFFGGGYKEFKQGMGSQNQEGNGVNLTVTGDLMGAQSPADASFRVTETGRDYAMIGFTRAQEQQKAAGIIDKGREFWRFGDRPGEMDKAIEVLTDLITIRLSKTIEKLHGNP